MRPSGILSVTVVANRESSVSSSFPSPAQPGWILAPPVMFAKREGIPRAWSTSKLGRTIYSARTLETNRSTLLKGSTSELGGSIICARRSAHVRDQSGYPQVEYELAWKAEGA